MIKTIIVEDEPLLSEGVARCISNADPRYFVEQIFFNGEDALRYIRENQVDLAVTDIKMPKLNGLDLIRAARQISPCRFIVITGFEDFHTAKESLNLGVFAFVSKIDLLHELPVHLQKFREFFYRENFPALPEHPQYVKQENPNAAIIAQSKEYIDAHIFDKITLQTISKLSSMSVSTYCKEFKKYYNMTFLQYLNSQKMKYAFEMLSEGQSISAVAESLGYREVNSFRKIFRKFFNINPGEVRK